MASFLDPTFKHLLVSDWVTECSDLRVNASATRPGSEYVQTPVTHYTWPRINLFLLTVPYRGTFLKCRFYRMSHGTGLLSCSVVVVCPTSWAIDKSQCATIVSPTVWDQPIAACCQVTWPTRSLQRRCLQAQTSWIFMLAYGPGPRMASSIPVVKL